MDWWWCGLGFGCHDFSAKLNLMAKFTFYRTLWGIEDSVLEETLDGLKERGIEGLEVCLPFTSEKSRRLLVQLQDRFKMIFLIPTAGRKVQDHLKSIQDQLLDILKDFPNPEKVNIHGGQDSWDSDEVLQYFNGFLEIEKMHSVQLLHETHRGRILYSPWSSLRVFKQFPTLKLTADLSHWVVVAERHLLTEEFDQVMEIVARQTKHIHARPCSPQHIQLGNLDDPVYKEDLECFKKYWSRIVKKQADLGITEHSVDPEFGPFPYSPVLAHTNGVLASGLEDLVDGIVSIFKNEI